MRGRRKLGLLHLGVAAIWIAFLRSAWPASDLFHSIPEGRDTLEVLWALQWYREALGKGRSPFFYPLAFAPTGWHTANLAHTPFLIGLMLPWAVLGGEAFAFNVFGWIALTLAFGGAYRLSMRLSRDPWIATAAGITYAFLNTAYAGLREFGGYLHIMAGLALIPWLVLELEHCRSHGWRGPSVWRAGALWGIAASVHPQMLLIGGVPVLIYPARKDDLRKMIRALIIITVSALALSGPWLVLFRWSFVQDDMRPHTVDLLKDTGYDWGFAFQWNPYSPFRSWIDPVPVSSKPPPIGLLPWVIGGPILIWGLIKKRGSLGSRRLLVIAWISAFTSAGIMLAWRGPVVFNWPTWLVSAHQALWRWGYFLNPSFLETPHIPREFLNRLYSPLFLLGILTPVLSYAPALNRYVGLFVLGSMAAITEAIAHTIRPRLARLVIGLIWLLELYSVAPAGWRWPVPPHPAYEWLKAQTGEGMVLELEANSVTIRSSWALLATLYHRKPAVNGWGSFYPRWFVQLDQLIAGSMDRIQRLGAVGIRYLILHRGLEGSAAIPVPRDLPTQCFDPIRAGGPWDDPICVMDLSHHPLVRITNLFLVEGWSGAESWGVWADSLSARALWMASRPTTFELEIHAFPFCPADSPQRISVLVNDRPLTTLLFPDCEEQLWVLRIPADWIRKGWNTLDLAFAYARSPAEVSGGRNPDPRTLAVGFRGLWTREKPGG
ncbi:hypothetical protein [Thermoflexus sp.]|uniref:hypothetical protein n=1 Tax=Thermoflexus sp. TaxID=1969742 RepID=UPI0035E4333C